LQASMIVGTWTCANANNVQSGHIIRMAFVSTSHASVTHCRMLPFYFIVKLHFCSAANNSLLQ
jgi:hypothetical protein